MSEDKNSSCLNLDGDEIKEYRLSNDEYADIMKIQTDMMRDIGSSLSNQDILTRLCKTAESFLPNSVSSIMIFDKESGFLDVLSAPSISKEGVEALSGLCPGPGGGSCGNAVYRKEVQYVTAIKSDKRWDDLRELADAFGLAACWSRPVRSDSDEVLGTFAMSSFEERIPSDFHKSLLVIGASIVNIVLHRKEDNVA